MNFTFRTITLCVSLSYNLIMAKLEISSVNGTSIFTIFCSPGFMITFPFGNMGNDLFKKLKQHSHELNTPSSPNTFLIPKTKSPFS